MVMDNQTCRFFAKNAGRIVDNATNRPFISFDMFDNHHFANSMRYASCLTSLRCLGALIEMKMCCMVLMYYSLHHFVRVQKNELKVGFVVHV